MTRAGYLECERRWVYWLLILVAGWYGAYTFALRGGVFCNAQTANVVLFAMALGNGKRLSAAYLLLPISAYLMGSFISEWLGKTVKRLNLLRWDTLLVALEIVMVVLLAFMPASWPDQICQVTLNFTCAMQLNTYRQVEGVPAATTFVTNHIRQIGSNLAKLSRHPEDEELRSRVTVHGSMLLFFVIGAVISTMMCALFSYVSLLCALVPLSVVLAGLVHADLFSERGKLALVPHGH